MFWLRNAVYHAFLRHYPWPCKRIEWTIGVAVAGALVASAWL